MQEKSFVNSVIKTVAIATVGIIVVGHVEFDFRITKKKINLFESVIDTGKTIHKGYKLVRGNF